MTPQRDGVDGRPFEADWELFAVETLAELGWRPGDGKEFTPGSGHRRSWDDPISYPDLADAVERLNPALPPAAIAEVVRIASTASSQDSYEENRAAHALLVDGIRVTYTDEFGTEHTPTVRLVDVDDPARNEYRVLRQVHVIQGERNRRFDLVLYVNGLPVAVAELKRAGDPGATLADAHTQVKYYVDEFPAAFRFNVIVLLSDGVTAKYGTPFTPYEHFAPWNTDENGEPVARTTDASDAFTPTAQDLALYGLFEPSRFLTFVTSFVNFVPTKHEKRIAKPHQFFAVSKAADAVRRAAASDGRAGVVWHTQGSGKSEEMVLTSNLVMRDPALHNPTIVVVTDRTDLDDQLFTTFAESEILPEEPVRLASRAELREALTRRTGGILFTTLQKFGRTTEERESGTEHPLLSDRRNIVVVVDEAHRSHYDHLDGYARHLRDALPHATLLAFTGTPISQADRNTRDVFGYHDETGYIDIYDLKRAADDGATVKVYHESRVVALQLEPGTDPASIDAQADRITDGLDDAERTKIEADVATMNAMYGAPARLRELADDLVGHWETRRDAMLPFVADVDDEPGGAPGKAMIVCATRDICVKVYDGLRERRPSWHDEDPLKGAMKIVFSSDSRKDPEHLREHALRASTRRKVIERAKDPSDGLQLLIVNSMLLTGFDAPPVHTMYLDRPMRGAGLMQALARVNRRHRRKADGLLVGYTPLTENLQKAILEYSPDDRHDRTLGQDVDRALDELRNELEILEDMLSRWNWRERLARTGKRSYIDAVLTTVNFLRNPATPGNDPEKLDDPSLTLKRRFREHAHRLERFFALAGSSANVASRFADRPHWKRDVGFFVEVRTVMAKLDAMDREARGLPVAKDVAMYLAQLTSAVIETGGVTDLFDEAGLAKADLTSLNEAVVERMRNSTTPHLDVEALRRLIEKTMRNRTRHNVVRRTAFSERLQDLMTRYMRQQLTGAEVILRLVALANEIAEERRRGERFEPPLDDDELAFYDAVAEHGNARELMGDEVLAAIARDLVVQVRKNLKPDWIAREPVRAKLRSTIKRLLAKHRYPPEKRDGAIRLVIDQMEHFADEWSTA